MSYQDKILKPNNATIQYVIYGLFDVQNTQNLLIN